MKNLRKRIVGFVLTAVLASGIVCHADETENGSVKANVPEVVKVNGGTVRGAVYPYVRYPGVFPEGRTVILSSFYMGKYEVTQAQYKFVMEGQKVTVSGTEYVLDGSPSQCDGSDSSYGIDYGKDHSNYPVECVSWYEAICYCNALSIKEGLNPCYTITVKKMMDGRIRDADVAFDKSKNGYRLPTEAEWEYAARGGDTTVEDWNYIYSGAGTPVDMNSFVDDTEGFLSVTSIDAALDSVGWYCYNNKDGKTSDINATEDESGRGTHEVGKKSPNRLGIYDMSGNVGEWCWDWSTDVEKEIVRDPVGPAEGYARVNRGGGWDSHARYQLVSGQNGDRPNDWNDDLGFRVCRNAQ